MAIKMKILNEILKSKLHLNLLSSARFRYMEIKYSIFNPTAKKENIIINKNNFNYHNTYYYKYAEDEMDY